MKRKDKNVPAGYRSLTKGATTFTITVEASEQIIERLAMMLLLAEIPLVEREKKVPVLLPYETVEPDELEPLPVTREELQEKAGKVITDLTKTWATAMDCVKALLASFSKPRISELSDEQLPVFVAALGGLPMDPAKVPAYIEALHASESLI